MVNESFPIHTMSTTVEVTTSPTYLRIGNIRNVNAVIGFDDTDPGLTNAPMAYINIMRTD